MEVAYEKKTPSLISIFLPILNRFSKFNMINLKVKTLDSQNHDFEVDEAVSSEIFVVLLQFSKNFILLDNCSSIQRAYC